MDAFEIFFRQADTDGDGRISGAEAVTFFRGTGLPQITLAKIWQLSDQAQRGFLTKPEFVHALKLVTVAQSGRELTPEIARVVSTGPASAQIPPPRIVQTPQVPLHAQAPPSQLHAQPASVPQYRPPLQNQRGSYAGQPIRPQFQPVTPTWRPNPAAGATIPDGFGGTSFQAGPEASKPSPTVTSASSGAAFTPVVSTSSGPDDLFGSDAFSARPGSADLFGGGTFTADEKAIVPTSTMSPASTTLGTGTAIVPVTPMASASSSSMQASAPAGASPAMSTSAPAVSTPSASFGLPPASAPGQSYGRPTGAPVQAFGPPGPRLPGAPVFNQGVSAAPGVTWPKISQADIERYTSVFVSVDTDRDGKILGDQARDLFFSWRLPRDVLKQIWDLADQDGDSMLSLREFCIALYFMERYREGRPVPPVLPTGFLPEGPVPQPQAPPQQTWQGPGPVRPPGLVPHRPVAQVSPSNTGMFPGSQTAAVAPGLFPGSQTAGVAAPGLFRGSQTAAVAAPGLLPGSQTAGLMPVQASPADTVAQSIPYKSRVPPLEIELVNQLNRDDQATLKSKHQEAEAADKKVFELDRDIKKSSEMIEFYRAKLQEIIMFKTRSDNQLLEMTERLAADRREVEKLRKRYDLKFQQAGESNSRLQVEEVAFRDIQQRKMELYNAIAKLDQGSKKEDLQGRADQISADLNELKTLLNQRAKSLGLRARATSAMELPFGWQPGIQEKAVDWNSWDKFDDEGFVYFQQTEETKQVLKEKDENAANGPTDKALENRETEKTEEKSKSAEENTAKDKSASEEAATANGTLTTEEKSEEAAAHAEHKKKERETTEPPASPSWSVFGDEPAWNLSQDFGKLDTGSSETGGIMGLKSIKTSVPSRAGDASVPETPLFKAGDVPETPLFTARDVPDTPLFSTLSPPKLDHQQSMRAGDESVPETPLFKSPDDGSSRDAFARFDSFGDFGRFDDAGSSSFDSANHWSTF